MLRPPDLSLTVTGTFHASTLFKLTLSVHCTDSFSMFGVVGAELTTNLTANLLLFDIVGQPVPSIISTLPGSKPSQTTDRVRLCLLNEYRGYCILMQSKCHQELGDTREP
jgi:hypothetical protein